MVVKVIVLEGQADFFFIFQDLANEPISILAMYNASYTAQLSVYIYFPFVVLGNDSLYLQAVIVIIIYGSKM